MRAALVAIALALTARTAAAADAPDALGARLDAALNSRALRGARVAARVESENGRVLYEHSGEELLAPASNMKVLTALAALRAFGPSHTFETHVLATRAPDTQGGVEVLYVRGGGDPALTSEDVWRLAAELRRTGLRQIRQGIVLDDSYFDAERWNPAWGPVNARAFYAPIGALTVNYGAFSVVVSPLEAAGEVPRVVVDPPISFLHVTNQARTGPTRGAHTLRVERRAAPRGEEVVVSGALARGSAPQSVPRSVLDPTGYFGGMLALQLEAIGIRVQGEVRPGGVPADAVSLLAFRGAPLSDVVRRFEYSNNQIGEALVKALGAQATGRPGSWENGLVAERAQLESAGLPLEGSVMLDGSGLSHENRVSPRLLVAALRSARDSFEYGAEFEAALPIAGVDGTLEHRAAEAGTRVRAKTGLLTRVTGLSGYARLSSGERAVFSVLVNGFRGSPHGAMHALDDFVAALVDAKPPAGPASPSQEEDEDEPAPED